MTTVKNLLEWKTKESDMTPVKLFLRVHLYQWHLDLLEIPHLDFAFLNISAKHCSICWFFIDNGRSEKDLNRHKSQVLKDFPEVGCGDKPLHFASIRLKISAWLLGVQRTRWVQLLQGEREKKKVVWWLSKHLARVLCFYYTLLMLRGLKE